MKTGFRWAVVIGASLVLALIIVGCNLFDRDHANPTTPGGDVTALTNYIVSGAEDGGWTAYYQPGDTYFKLTIPIVGAIKIQYTIIRGVQTGLTFTIVLRTTQPTTHEVGLMTFDVDGQPVTDVVDCVTVIYVENGDFAQIPANAFAETGAQYVEYKRQTGDNETEVWWPAADAAQFVFSGGAPQTVQPYCQGQLLVDEGQPASRPEPEPVAPVAPVAPAEKGFLYGGLMWFKCIQGEPNSNGCIPKCLSVGGTGPDEAVSNYFNDMSDDDARIVACLAILTGLGYDLTGLPPMVAYSGTRQYCRIVDEVLSEMAVGYSREGWLADAGMCLRRDTCACKGL